MRGRCDYLGRKLQDQIAALVLLESLLVENLEELFAQHRVYPVRSLERIRRRLFKVLGFAWLNEPELD